MTRIEIYDIVAIRNRHNRYFIIRQPVYQAIIYVSPYFDDEVYIAFNDDHNLVMSNSFLFCQDQLAADLSQFGFYGERNQALVNPKLERLSKIQSFTGQSGNI